VTFKYILFKVYSDRYGCLWAKPRIYTHPRTAPERNTKTVVITSALICLTQARIHQKIHTHTHTHTHAHTHTHTHTHTRTSTRTRTHTHHTHTPSLTHTHTHTHTNQSIDEDHPSILTRSGPMRDELKKKHTHPKLKRSTENTVHFSPQSNWFWTIT